MKLNVYTKLWSVSISIVIVLCNGAVNADTWIDPETGIEWRYIVADGEVTLGLGSSSDSSTAVPKTTVGDIVIPAEINGYPVTSIRGFYNCDSITSVTIPDSVTNIGRWEFDGCYSLVCFYVSEGNANYKSVNGLLLSKDGTTIVLHPCGLKNIVIPDGVTDVSFSYDDKQSIVSLTIPGSVKDPLSLCPGHNLERIVFDEDCGLTLTPNLDAIASSPTCEFDGCCSLRDVTFPGRWLDEISGNLRSFLPGFFEWWPYVYDMGGKMEYVYDRYPPMYVLFGDAAIGGITSYSEYDMGYVYFGGITNVTLVGSTFGIPYNAFANCSALASIVISDSATITNVDMTAFTNCPATISYKGYYCTPMLEPMDSFVAFLETGNMSGVSTEASRSFVRDNCTFHYHLEGTAFSKIVVDSVEMSEGDEIEYPRLCNRPIAIGEGAFSLIPKSVKVIFKGGPPEGLAKSGLSRDQIIIPPSYAEEYLPAIEPPSHAEEYLPAIEILSSGIRKTANTVFDIEYKASTHLPPLVMKVRALAFENGERSFAKVIRPETFIEDVDGNPTEQNIGDEVEANIPHKLSWKVSEDWATRLAKVKFEVLALNGDLFPLRVWTIPASDRYGKMMVTSKPISDEQLFAGLLWFYASKEEGLTLTDGILKDGLEELANGTAINRANAARYIYLKMGFLPLEGDALEYVSGEMRLDIPPDEACRYAYKIIEGE